MKKFIISVFLFISFIIADAQTDRAQGSSDLKTIRQNGQVSDLTAKLISASRLFRYKDDLTSVILIIPSDSVVTVLDSADTYLHVIYENNEGYIYSHHAKIIKSEPSADQSTVNDNSSYQSEPVPDSSSAGNQQADKRLLYLEKKYGQTLAGKIYSRKIWKGMTTEMVSDSWGSPRKISKLIDSIRVKEKWIYNNCWLHFNNNILDGWGR